MSWDAELTALTSRIADRLFKRPEPEATFGDLVRGLLADVPRKNSWQLADHLLLTELAHLDLAYVHLEATADEDVLIGLRRVWPGTLIMNPVLPMGPKQTGRAEADRWLGLGADLISFGRGFLANPDLVERLRTGLPIAPVDEATYYQGGDAGYLTYSTYQYTA
ncbi:hypothetical protein OHA77_05210 [Streptosporangium sp. NBC_01639]|uniref:hypothetical protein n=1 Tax=Streptosporangium sp. NBC_01639 TaxID=2975948 RepID=UPI00386C0BC2|nr:hypothetical protein OHA77_05210 [Streptosporangium sp. NBC_01639]